MPVPETMQNPIEALVPDTPIARQRGLYRIAEPYDGYSVSIAARWPGAPGTIGAAFWSPEPVTAHAIDRQSREVIYMFAGDSYYRFDAKLRQLDRGYPKAIHGSWTGLFQQNLSAAMRNQTHAIWSCTLGEDCVLAEPSDFWFMREGDYQSFETTKSCVE